MDVYWLEQTDADLPPGNEWLSSAEAQRLAYFRFPKRRMEWRLGRWTAKRAVAACRGAPSSLSEIEIQTAPSGAPQVDGFSISISHREGTACCALTPAAIPLGCDVELIEPHSSAFLADYFTKEEQDAIEQSSSATRNELVALFWSAKESALKMLGAGLREDTRSVVVDAAPLHRLHQPSGPEWRRLAATHADSALEGWWRSDGRLVRTIVANLLPLPPVVIR
jgi:phosphopantetheinyl transferase